MRRRQLLFGLPLLALLGPARAAHSQALVYDAANWLANIGQFIQTLLIVANQILDLTALGEVVMAADDMRELSAVIEDGYALKIDFTQLHLQVTALFDLNTAPDTRAGLDARILQMKTLMYETRAYGIKVQGLMWTVQRTIEHINRLINDLGAVLGNMQGQQTMAQLDTTVSKTLALMEVQNAAMQRSDTVDKLSEALVIESVNRINKKRIADWPTW